jgi:hypothetical protein
MDCIAMVGNGGVGANTVVEGNDDELTKCSSMEPLSWDRRMNQNKTN